VALLAAAIQFARSSQQLKPPQLLGCAVLVAFASLPSFLLWSAESFLLSVLADTITTSVADASTHLSRLLIAAAALGLVVLPLAVAATIFLSLRVRRSPPMQRGRLQATTWLLIAVLLGTLAGCFYLRSTRLYDAAITGSLRSVA
jgi:hypothetical protein